MARDARPRLLQPTQVFFRRPRKRLCFHEDASGLELPLCELESRWPARSRTPDVGAIAKPRERLAAVLAARLVDLVEVLEAGGSVGFLITLARLRAGVLVQ